MYVYIIGVHFTRQSVFFLYSILALYYNLILILMMIIFNFSSDSSVPSSQLLRLAGPGSPPGTGGGAPLPPQEQPGLPLQQDNMGSWCSG